MGEGWPGSDQVPSVLPPSDEEDNHLIAQGLRPGRGRSELREYLRQEARRLSAEGLRDDAIARRMGVDVNTVRRWLTGGQALQVRGVGQGVGRRALSVTEKVEEMERAWGEQREKLLRHPSNADPEFLKLRLRKFISKTIDRLELAIGESGTKELSGALKVGVEMLQLMDGKPTSVVGVGGGKSTEERIGELVKMLAGPLQARLVEAKIIDSEVVGEGDVVPAVSSASSHEE